MLAMGGPMHSARQCRLQWRRKAARPPSPRRRGTAKASRKTPAHSGPQPLPALSRYRPSAASSPQPLSALSRFPRAPFRLGQPPLASFVGHPDAQACIKSAYVNGGEVFVTKVVGLGLGLGLGPGLGLG